MSHQPPDPILAALSLLNNPLIINMSDEELRSLLERTRTIAQPDLSIPSLETKSTKSKSPTPSKAAKLQNFIDNLWSQHYQPTPQPYTISL